MIPGFIGVLEVGVALVVIGVSVSLWSYNTYEYVNIQGVFVQGWNMGIEGPILTTTGIMLIIYSVIA
jgi:hypothetical protein